MDEFKEQWRPIKGFGERYSISNTGHVCLRADRSVRVPTTVTNGVVHARLRHRGDYSHHRVDLFVLEAFHGKALPGLTPYHLDGDIENTSAENLRWYAPPGWRACP